MTKHVSDKAKLKEIAQILGLETPNHRDHARHVLDRALLGIEANGGIADADSQEAIRSVIIQLRGVERELIRGTGQYEPREPAGDASFSEVISMPTDRFSGQS